MKDDEKEEKIESESVGENRREIMREICRTSISMYSHNTEERFRVWASIIFAKARFDFRYNYAPNGRTICSLI